MTKFSKKTSEAELIIRDFRQSRIYNILYYIRRAPSSDTGILVPIEAISTFAVSPPLIHSQNANTSIPELEFDMPKLCEAIARRDIERIAVTNCPQCVSDNTMELAEHYLEASSARGVATNIM